MRKYAFRLGPTGRLAVRLGLARDTPPPPSSSSSSMSSQAHIMARRASCADSARLNGMGMGDCALRGTAHPGRRWPRLARVAARTATPKDAAHRSGRAWETRRKRASVRLIAWEAARIGKARGRSSGNFGDGPALRHGVQEPNQQTDQRCRCARAILPLSLNLMIATAMCLRDCVLTGRFRLQDAPLELTQPRPASHPPPLQPPLGAHLSPHPHPHPQHPPPPHHTPHHPLLHPAHLGQPGQPNHPLRAKRKALHHDDLIRRSPVNLHGEHREYHRHLSVPSAPSAPTQSRDR